jgi:hypothetical protein
MGDVAAILVIWHGRAVLRVASGLVYLQIS